MSGAPSSLSRNSSSEPQFAPIPSRLMLESGEIEAVVLNDAPDLTLSTQAQREESLQTFLSQRPAGDLWLFGYGSLMWNPAIVTAERRKASIHGWHRSFCLTAVAGRGSAQRPGLFLGLEEGGYCAGSAFRIDEDDIESELSLVWMREMLCGGYVPRWVDAFDEKGEVFASAIAFTIDADSELYAGNLPTKAVVKRLATAAGGWGSSADYLFQTHKSLQGLGIIDPEIERLVIEEKAIHSEVAAAA